MSYQSYKDLEIYQSAHTLAVEIHTMTIKRLPDFERYEEGAQIRKSAKSICSNIVEGFGRRRHKNEFIQFLTYALASCDETREHLYLLWDTGSLKDKELYQHFNQKYDELGKKITKFIQAVEIGHLTLKSRIQNPESNKGAALIIVIFAMMLFTMLGLTLANLQSGDFEMNLRAFDSEQAFNLAEAGQEWAIQKLVLDEAWRTQDTGADADCNDPGDWENYSFGPGEYRVCCRNATVSEQLIGNIVIESQGYIPSIAKPRSIRQTKLILDIGSFDKVLIAKDLFDWSLTLTHTGSTMNGNIQALNYEGDGDNNHNEEGIDYRNGASPLPPGTGKNTQRIIASTPFPAIDMAYYEAQAKTPSYKPLNEDNIWAPELTATITNIFFEGGKRKIDIAPAFPGDANQWATQAIRNISGGSWQDGTWAVIDAVNVAGNTLTLDRPVVSWKLGERITLIPKILSIARTGNTYTIDFSCDVFTPPFSKWKNEAIRNFSKTTSNDWPYSDWGVITDNPTARQVKVTLDSSVNLDTNPWTIGQWVGIVKRYNNDVNNNTLWYIMADALLDLRANDITFKKTSLIAEGDIAIKGTGNNKIHFTEKPSAYPNVATKNGNIISLDTPGTGNDGARRQRRDFDDLVYTENGTLNFNYLDARAAYGNNIIFDGEIKLKYDKKLERRLTGFIWGLSNAQWQEQ